MITWSDGFWTLLAVLGTVLSAVCAGAEMGTYSLNRVRLNLRAAAGRRRSVLLKREVESGPRLLATLLLGYNLFSYVGALGMTTLLQRAGYSELVIVLLNILVIGPVLFVTQDTMPKEVFRAEADRLMHTIAVPISIFRFALTVTLVLPLVQGVARGVAALLPGTGEEEAVESARQRMAVLLKEGATHGAISAAQASMVDRALGLRDAQVGDEMTPWASAQTVMLSWDAARLHAFLRGRALSRYPVVDARGSVVGMVEHLDASLRPDQPVSGLMKPIATLRAEMSVRDALVKMREEGARLAVVMQGTKPVGVVTGKDLCEPLTGELRAW